MKITNLSLAAIAAMALTTGAMAGDKGIDFNIGGQAVVYYETNDAGDNDLFKQGTAANTNSIANAGIQLNADSDLGNGFGLGLQGSALNTWGLEKQVVSGTRQSATGNNGDTTTADNYFAITKAYITKKLGNTQLKLGRQELPKNLSPFAFSEGWSVFKNTFDAMVAINSDLPDTTLVGAFVSRSNNNGDIRTFGDLAAGGATKGAYMLTAQNKSVAGLTSTLSYYQLTSLAKVVWLDVQADMAKLAGAPVTVGLQGGQTKANASGSDAKKAAGIKVAGKAGPVNVSLAYTKVGTKGGINIANVGTSNKTPLYTQMVANQGDIKNGAEGTVLKVVAPAGPGKVIAQYGYMKDNINNNSDVQELDLIYKFKALGANMFAALVSSKADDKVYNADDTRNIVRFWTRYNF